MNLLKELCSIRAASGDEAAMTKFLINYIKKQQKHWQTQPEIFYGEHFQDCIVLVFGKPRTAIFAHIDSIGFNVKYGEEIVKIGGPKTKNDYELVGSDSKGEINCFLKVDKEDKTLSYSFNRAIERGTILTFKPNFRENEEYIESCYLDNRLGVWSALKVAETLKDGVIVFSTYEEHGGGSVEFLARFIYEKFNIKQALISDITWVTSGVEHGKGVAISIRDSGIPRRSYINKIIDIAKKSTIPFQLEVEDAGGSDGNALQHSPYPFDWCFVGAPEDNVHSPDERVHKKDIDAMVRIYQLLMKEL